MSGIGVIFNPVAGKNRKNKGKQIEIQKLLEGVGSLKVTRTMDDLNQAINDFKNQDIEIIAISGGDGTIHLVLSAVIQIYKDTPLPRFLALRSGTMNTFTNSVKFKGKTTGILKKAIDTYNMSLPFFKIEQHLVKVNDKYGFMTGGGIVSNFLDTYYSSKNPGPVQGAKMVSGIVLSTLFQTNYAKTIFSPTAMDITINGKRLPTSEYMYFLGCTIKELGLGFTPTPHAYDRPDHFHFHASSMKPLSLLPKLPSLYFGKDFTHPDMQHNGIAKEVIIEPKGKLRWMMDGDMYTTEVPLHMSAGPTITVVSP